MQRSGVFLQVRIASSRLARKAMLDLAGRPVLEHAMHALARVPADVYSIVTDHLSVDYFRDTIDRLGWDVFAGDPEDVLKRFVDAAHFFDVGTIVRATGDNPLVSARVATAALTLGRRSEADYAGILGTPLGTGVEVLRVTALEDVLARSRDRYEREHVGPGLHRHPERYRVVTEPAPPGWYRPELRVTLDTAEDYDQLQAIFADLYRGKPIEIDELVSYDAAHQRSSA